MPVEVEDANRVYGLKNSGTEGRRTGKKMMMEVVGEEGKISLQ